MGDWEFVPCDLCGGDEKRLLHEVPCKDAPDGAARIVECAACRLRYLSPRPSVSAIPKYYPNDYGAYVGRRRGVLKQRVWDFLRDCCSRAPTSLPRLLQETTARIVEWRFDINVRLDTTKPLRVLDVGCGFGDLLIYLASRGAEVVGVDLDERACQRAKEYGLDVRSGTLFEQGFENARFDVVVLSHSLEHMHYPQAVIREVRRVTRHGGFLHLALPNGLSVGFREEGPFWGHLSFPIHLYYFDERSLGEYLRRASFKVVRRRFKTISVFHWNSYAAIARDRGRAVALRIAGRVMAETLRSPRVGDTLCIVAEAG